MQQLVGIFPLNRNTLLRRLTAPQLKRHFGWTVALPTLLRLSPVQSCLNPACVISESDGSLVVPAAHYLAKISVFHCVLAQQGHIVGTALVVGIHESVRIGVSGLLHFQLFGLAVHLAYESIVALRLQKSGPLGICLMLEELAAAPDCEGSACVVATRKHQSQEQLLQGVNFPAGQRGSRSANTGLEFAYRYFLRLLVDIELCTDFQG